MGMGMGMGMGTGVEVGKEACGARARTSPSSAATHEW